MADNILTAEQEKTDGDEQDKLTLQVVINPVASNTGDTTLATSPLCLPILSAKR